MRLCEKLIVKYKKFIKDIILNLFASGIMVIVLQLLVYPFLGRINNVATFGEILVLMSIVNIIGVLLGSSLNNIRLKYYNDYLSNKLKGDFSLLLLISIVINALLIITILYIFFDGATIWELIALILLSILTMLRSYMTVEYRLKLQYNKILQHAFSYCLGLGFGLYIVYITSVWQFVFLFGELISFVFLLFTTNIIKEPYVKTRLFKSTSINFVFLALSNTLKNILLYLDRLILFPILGPYQVAVFFASTVIGKMTSFVLSPISGVVLSYLSRREENISLKLYFKINIMIVLFCLFVSILAIISSFFALPLIYPDIFYDTLDILVVANIAVVINASTSIPQTIVLKYSKTYHQINIQIIYTILYLGLGLLFLSYWGLLGFSIGLLITSVIKFLIIFMFGYISLSKPNY